MKSATAPSVLVVGDPMCSWCWGFDPELQELRRRFGELRFELKVGGLRTGPDLPAWEDLRGFLEPTWQRIGELTGQPFDRGLLARQHYRYDTEPACRAIVTARGLRTAGAEAQAFELFSRLQQAFYGAGRDLTQTAELVAIATEAGCDRVEFERAFEDPQSARATRDEFAACRDLGVSGFPTLLAVVSGQVQVLSRGFATAAELAPRLDQLL